MRCPKLPSAIHARQLRLGSGLVRMESGHACVSPVRIQSAALTLRIKNKQAKLNLKGMNPRRFAFARNSFRLCTGLLSQPAYQSEPATNGWDSETSPHKLISDAWSVRPDHSRTVSVSYRVASAGTWCRGESDRQ